MNRAHRASRHRFTAALATLVGCTMLHGTAAQPVWIGVAEPAATRRVAEPEVAGRVVDAATTTPIAGAVVFGYYATAAGSLGGGYALAGVHRRFAVRTDAEGFFTLEAWTPSPAPAGQRRERFPIVAIFKPGYRTELRGLNSITQWLTPSPQAGRAAATRVELQPASSAELRYIDLGAAGLAMELSAPCAWQIYVPALQALHDELKALIRETVPANDLNEQGYLRSGRPGPLVNVDFLTHSFVDRLIDQQRRNPSAWSCADPAQLLRGSR